MLKMSVVSPQVNWIRPLVIVRGDTHPEQTVGQTNGSAPQQQARCWLTAGKSRRAGS